MKTALAAMLAVAFLSVPTAAVAASDAPDPVIAVDVSPASCAGQALAVQASAKEAGYWTVRSGRRQAEGSGRRVVASFPTASAEAGDTVLVKVQFHHDGGTVTRTKRATLPACPKDDAIAVTEAAGIAGDGSLPLPSGAAWWILPLGLMAVVVGRAVRRA